MIYAIIQARMGSSRLPNKIFKKILGKPLLWHVVNRLRFSKKIDKIIIATTIEQIDNFVYNWCKKNNIDVFRGDEDNVLKRYYDTCVSLNLKDDDVVIRITSDDPFKDPYLIDDMLTIMKKENLDFIYNNKPVSYPEGLDVEIFKFSLLKNNIDLIIEDFDKEHITQYFYRMDNIKKKNFKNNVDLSHLRWTIDTKLDIKMVRKIYKNLYKEGDLFSMKDILEYLEKNPNVYKINSEVKRSLMYGKNK
jgi:spore coat polysaccharide biosynthesis protein SpsF